MNSEQHDNYIILQDERGDIQQFATFLTSIYDQFVDKNLIVDLLKYEAATLMDLLSFLELSNKHRAAKHSFVLVNTALSRDEIPDELLVVPTVHEAKDVISMEEMERELGF
ncbi:ribonuclease Z [Nonlabens dokdonensis]|uniref:Ribonuclease Z n=1 Tax=Nonlabens dokdonensis TaxID=328515 RepID=A0A1Z8AW67_9FLAO|nr:ribonuclease Z [Nonlabens dokdonensis]OUS14576.1 ribonuclease Z [Nonlabens dokdonensis]